MLWERELSSLSNGSLTCHRERRRRLVKVCETIANSTSIIDLVLEKIELQQVLTLINGDSDFLQERERLAIVSLRIAHMNADLIIDEGSTLSLEHRELMVSKATEQDRYTALISNNY